SGCGYSCPRLLRSNFPEPEPILRVHEELSPSLAGSQQRRAEGVQQGRPTPEQRADGVPSYKSQPGSAGARLRMSFGSGTVCRGSGPAGTGRSGAKVGCCEKCSAALVGLKKQALSLAVHHHFSYKETSDLPSFLHDNLRVHTRPYTESRERERELGVCGACGANLSQLKHEAIHLALSRGRSLARPQLGPGLRAGAVLGHTETKHEDRVTGEAVHQARSQSHSPQVSRSPRTTQRTPQRTPQTLRRRGGKLPNHDMDRWVQEQQQLVGSKSTSTTDGVSLHSHHKAADGSTVTCGDAGTIQASSRIPHISRMVTIANTAAMSLLANAAEKLNMTLRKKGQASDPAPSSLTFCFREIIQKNPPPVPSVLLQAAARTKDLPDVAKVKVVLRVSRLLSESQDQQPPVLWIDPAKKRVTIMDPVTKTLPYSSLTLGRQGKRPLKTFSFDAAFSQDSGQAEVCAGVLTDVLRCVLSGSDGCVLGLGSADVGSWSSMVGSGENIQKLGLIPFAISWLYGAIERRRERTWTDLTVSVSAIELCCGEEDTLRDLLGEVGPSSGGIQDSPKAHVRVQEDPTHGIQIRNHNRVKAPTAERAASLLDAAIAARRRTDFVTYLCHSSIMFFTLYIQPPRTESSTIGKGSKGPPKLTMIDVCSGMRGVSRSRPTHSELGPIVLSLLGGHKTTPSKVSKLSMLLRESMLHSNCHVAVVAQVADSLAQLQESFSTIQLASRIRRTQKRTKQSTSRSPCGRSLPKEKRGALPLRAFHSTEEVDLDGQPFCLRGRLDRSSSDQSCDTVIQINSDGSVHSKAAPLLTQPRFVPIIPSLHPNKGDLDDLEFTALLEELLRIPQLHEEKKAEEAVQGCVDALKTERKSPERDCLKCDTFAELQERLGCIDGSEMTMDVLKSSLKSASLKNLLTKPQIPKETSEASQTLLTTGMGYSQTALGEKKSDGASSGDSFQREDSGLFDCEECSGTSSSEELLNQTLGLSMTGRSEFPNTRPSNSGNKQDSRGKTTASPSDRHPSDKQECQESADWFKADKRASPVGKSSPISPSSSCSPNSLAKSIVIGDILPNRTTQTVKEMKATITVTVQQPLDQTGQDELVLSMVEEVTFSGAYDRGNTGGNIICIREPAQPHVQTAASCHPIKIISNVSDDDSSAAAGSSVVQPTDSGASREKNSYPLRREKGFLPSFINPMLIDTDLGCDLDGAKGKERPQETLNKVKVGSELKRNVAECQEGEEITDEPNRRSHGTHQTKKCEKECYSASAQMSYGKDAFRDKDRPQKTDKSKMCEKRHENMDPSVPRQRQLVCFTNREKLSAGAASTSRPVDNIPQRTAVVPGCQETNPASSQTSSLPKAWRNLTHQESHLREVTSSTPCSPGEVLETRHGRQQSAADHGLHSSSSPKLATKFKQDPSGALRKATGSSMTSSWTRKLDDPCSRLKSPAENSSKLFSTKLEQLATRTNSLGRTPRDFPTLERGSSNTSVSSKGSSRGSAEAAWKVGCKENCDRECTFPRSNKSPRRNPRSDLGHHFFHSENSTSSPAKNSPSKLSAVGKLRMGSPKVRRLSTPSIKSLSMSHKSLQQSNRSASLSPDCKTVSFERTSSFFSSSPPRSHRSISRTPSQSSTCSSTKSAIQGFVSSKISDFLRERAPSPTLAGLDHMTPLPSPYSQVTAPRIPDDLNGHASDTTSVLSGDLPPAMGKTSLHFSNRSSLVSSGYDSLVRDSEGTGSSASNRGSISDRSGSLLSAARSSRSSRRRGNAGLSHDAPLSMKRSASGLRSRWTDRGIPEAYEIKVYEIDDVQRMQKTAGPCMLQRQAAVCGAPSTEDLRGSSPIQQLGERARAGPTQPHAAACQTEPRVRPAVDYRGGLPGTSGGL
ncbi:kinesin-like protein KIF26B, partial [Nothobranchius furzeri]